MRNLDNVFIGFTKNGEEHIFLKRFSCYDNGVNYMYYIDLETREEIEINQIDTKTLVPITQSLNIPNSWTTKKKVVNIYNMDRDKLIDTKGVFYGNLITTAAYKNENSSCVIYDEKILDENVLFARFDDPFGRMLKLNNSTPYYKKRKGIRGYAVVEKRSINREKLDGIMQPKKLLLEMDYRKEL